MIETSSILEESCFLKIFGEHSCKGLCLIYTDLHNLVKTHGREVAKCHLTAVQTILRYKSMAILQNLLVLFHKGSLRPKERQGLVSF